MCVQYMCRRWTERKTQPTVNERTMRLGSGRKFGLIIARQVTAVVLQLPVGAVTPSIIMPERDNSPKAMHLLSGYAPALVIGFYTLYDLLLFIVRQAVDIRVRCAAFPATGWQSGTLPGLCQLPTRSRYKSSIRY